MRSYECGKVALNWKSVGSFDSILNEARNFACGLYKNQPGALIPNAANDVLRFAWDNLCDYPGSPGLPPPPSVPFQGGQCNCVLYSVSVFNDVSTGSGEALGVFGEVGGVRIVLIPRPDGEFSASYEILCRGFPGSGGCSVYQWYRYRFSPFLPNAQNAKNAINSITRVDGQPDNCGNPPASYPPGAPPPPGGFVSPPVPIPLADGDSITVNFNFSPPSVPEGIADFIPPIVINYFKPEFKIPIEFNFNGDVNFGAPSGGGGFSENDRDTINNINTNINNVGGVTNNINNKIDNFVNIQRNKKRPDSDFEPSPPPKPPGKHEQENLEAVEINLTALPINAKKQWGAGAPDVVYAGWFEFQREGKSLPRHPIHFQGSVFKAPVGVDGYAYTLYIGYQGEARAIVNKLVESDGS